MTEFMEGRLCKHCGGTKKYASSRGCVRCSMGRRRDQYSRNIKSSAIGPGRGGDAGYAGELIVRTDLLLRGLDVTVPENRCCPDDVHFLSSSGWMSIQVKVSQVNNKTGNWYCQVSKSKPAITSDILAWVNLRDREIRYVANVKPVPPELLT